MKWLGPLLRLLELIVSLLRRAQRAAQQRRNQKARDELEDNPAAWFDGRFGGLRDNQRPADADPADPRK